MTFLSAAAMAVWTAAGAVLLFLLMWIDSIFTKYKDLEEMKKGNNAVTARFVMKLFAQGYILAQSISRSDNLWSALAVSIVSFIILLILQKIAEWLLKNTAGLDLDQGTLKGITAYGFIAGSLHITGALILAACL